MAKSVSIQTMLEMVDLAVEVVIIPTRVVEVEDILEVEVVIPIMRQAAAVPTTQAPTRAILPGRMLVRAR